MDKDYGIPRADEACQRALVERHERFDLAFVEISERGNVFSRENLAAVVDCARDSHSGPCATDVPKSEQMPRNVVVFIHGWKHDGRSNDDNVKSFRKALDHLALVSSNQRRPFGIYVGWRGATLRPIAIPISWLANLTFWDRKGAAHEIGKGAVTELLLRLEAAVHDEPKAKEKDALVIAGHSFGGAIALASLTEVFLDRIVRIGGESCQQWADADDPTRYRDCCNALPPVDPVGNGVVLLNPAIEANEAMQLKELVSERRGCFPEQQPNLLTSISSKEDMATRVAFPVGMWMRLLWWDEEDLPRAYGTLEENRAGIETVGNLPEFRTVDFSFDSEGLSRVVCRPPDTECLHERDERYRANAVRRFKNEPVEFLYTDDAFIRDHNDVFNPKVEAYLSTLVNLSAYRTHEAAFRPSCASPGGFLFENCFNGYLRQFEACAKDVTADACRKEAP